MLLRKGWAKREEEGGGEGGDKSGGGGDKTAEQLEMLTRGLTILSTSITKMQEGYNTLQGKLQELEGTGNRGKSTDDDEPPDIDLESMDRKQFAQFILSKMGEGVGGKLEKLLEEKFGKLSEGLGEVRSRLDVKETADKSADFWEWKGEIRDVLRRYPDMAVDDAYKLARSKHPDKAKKMDEKYFKTPTKKTADEVYAGLSMSPTSSRTTKSTTMKPTEAAEAAWDAVMSQAGEG